MNDVSGYLGRQRGGGVSCRKKSDLVVSGPSARVSNVREVKTVLLTVKNEDNVREMRPFDQ